MQPSRPNRNGHPISLAFRFWPWSEVKSSLRRGKEPFPRWVKRVGFVTSTVCPVDPKQQTFPDSVDTSHLCQNRKSHSPSIWTISLFKLHRNYESPLRRQLPSE